MNTVISTFLNTDLSGEYPVMLLLVDDQAMVGEAIRRLLVDEPNVEFHFCSNPEEALTVAAQIHPTVILQDLVMPDVDGLTMVRRYRTNANTKNIPIIVLSTREEPKVKAEAFAAGANDYLVKLPDQVELVARIRYHSKAYMYQVQRDAAYRALHESQQRLMELNIQLQRVMNMDGLTGLNNRQRFDEYAASEWKRAGREKASLAVCMIDVDYFKQYNDSYGHPAGDELLKKIAGVIQQIARRPADLSARFGGDELALILPNTPVAGTKHLAETICRTVDDLNIPHTGSAVTDHATVSIGCASRIPQPGDSFLSLLESADLALYDAKKKGRNQVVICV